VAKNDKFYGPQQLTESGLVHHCGGRLEKYL